MTSKPPVSARLFSAIGAPLMANGSPPAKFSAAMGVTSPKACRQPMPPNSLVSVSPTMTSVSPRSPSVMKVVSRSLLPFSAARPPVSLKSSSEVLT